jgi:hypothetical protein
MFHLKKIKTTVPTFDSTYSVQEILNDPGKYLNINIFKKKKVLFLHSNERFEKILEIHEENHSAYRHTQLKVQESF